MVQKMLNNKKLDLRVAALKPEKLSTVNIINRLNPARPTSSNTPRLGQRFGRTGAGREVIDLEEEPEDVIDLGAPRLQRRRRSPAHETQQRTSPRLRTTYIPNPRLYPGPQPKPKQKTKRKLSPKSGRSEGRVNAKGQGRRRRRVYRRPVPNSRLYRPAPPRPPPPPLQPHAYWPPPPPPRPLDTASRVALSFNEQRRRPRSSRGPRRSPARCPTPEPPADPRRLVVTLPAAGGGDQPPTYRPASEHFRSRAPPDSGSSTPPAAARVRHRSPLPATAAAMDTASRHSTTPEDRSEGNETLSAPSEFLAEFLSAIMRRQYAEALKYCRLILQYEPQNSTARSFYPLLRHKVHAHRRAEKAKGAATQWSSSEESAGEAEDGNEVGVASSAGGAGGSAGGSTGGGAGGDSDSEPEGSVEEESGGSVASQSSLELDSSPSVSLSRRTERTDSASGGCWESTGSASRSDPDDNGNATHTTHKTIQPGDVENDNAGGEPGIQAKSDSLSSLRRLRAQFACSIK